MRVTSLFAYGTLMVPAVMCRVIGTELPATPARLRGHVRYRMRGGVYPGIVRRPGLVIDGLLFRDIDAATWQLLDRFEDSQYDRVTVRTDITRQKRAEEESTGKGITPVQFRVFEDFAAATAAARQPDSASASS